MNEWVNDNLSTLLGGVFVLIAAVVATIKGGSLLEALRLRKIRRLRAKVQNACPHVRMILVEGETRLESLAYSPPGTLYWYCERCNALFHENGARRIGRSVAGHGASRIGKRIKKADKLRKRLDLLGKWAEVD